VRCKVGKRYCFGGRHAVREIVFEDDVHWIARVQLPDVNPDASEKYVPKPVGFGWTKERYVENAAKMQSEIDTMAYIRDMTDVPVPQVFFAETKVENPVGAPYMFMDGTLISCHNTDFSGQDMEPKVQENRVDLQNANGEIRNRSSGRRHRRSL